MRRATWALATLLGACSAPGYLDPADSAHLVREIGDENVASRVRMALSEDPQTAPYTSIRVGCVDGVVTLEGKVDRAAVRSRAVIVAEGCDGVRFVVDRLRP